MSNVDLHRAMQDIEVTLRSGVIELCQQARQEGFKDGFQKGFEEGESKQAILEIRGRDKFLEDVRKKIAAGEEV